MNESVKEEALQAARMSGWKKYVATFNSSKRSNYSKLENQFVDNLSDYVIEEVVIQEKTDKKNKTYKVALRLVIDDVGVDALFSDLSEAGNQALGMASNFGSVFIARVVREHRSFDDRKVAIAESQSEMTIDDTSARDESRSVDSVSKRSLSRTATGGSTTRQRDAVEYEVNDGLQAELTTSMNEHLVNAGFEPIEYYDLQEFGAPPVEDVYGELSQNAVMGGRLKKEITDSAVAAGWTYLGFGTVDIGAPMVDPASGLQKVSANVQYKVLMLDGGRARTVASVRPTQVWALAEDAGFAETEALNKAAEAALDSVVAQLQKKGVR